MPAKRASRKTATKTASELRTPAHGRGALLPGGKPGNKGGTGRPKNEYKEFLRGLLRSPECQSALKTILKNPDHPAFSAVFGKVVVHAEGIPGAADGGEGGSGRPHVSLDI